MPTLLPLASCRNQWLVISCYMLVADTWNLHTHIYIVFVVKWNIVYGCGLVSKENDLLICLIQYLIVNINPNVVLMVLTYDKSIIFWLTIHVSPFSHSGISTRNKERGIHQRLQHWYASSLCASSLQMISSLVVYIRIWNS